MPPWLVAIACSAPTIDNPNSPTVAGAASSPLAIQQLATGVMAGWRGTLGGLRSDWGMFGRESYNFTLGDTRATTNFLIGIAVGANRLDPAGFANGEWSGQYTALHNIYNFNIAVAAAGSSTISAAQKSASLGLMKTIEAALLLQVIESRDTLGGIVQIESNPSVLAPFVTRDSMYKCTSSANSRRRVDCSPPAAHRFAVYAPLGLPSDGDELLDADRICVDDERLPRQGGRALCHRGRSGERVADGRYGTPGFVPECRAVRPHSGGTRRWIVPGVLDGNGRCDESAERVLQYKPVRTHVDPARTCSSRRMATLTAGTSPSCTHCRRACFPELRRLRLASTSGHWPRRRWRRCGTKS